MINIYYQDISALDVPTMRMKALELGLKDVVEKAGRMGHKLTALHYLCGELLMRKVCEEETGIAPADQRFSYNEHGKPSLLDNDSWHYNKSHSGQYVVVATSPSPVGVDVEKISDSRMNVADRYFSTDEITLLHALDKEHQDQLFYQFWTSREAYLKFLGTGISYGLENFRIKKHYNGTFTVIDPKGPDCQLTLNPLPGLYQLAVCGAENEVTRLIASE